MHLARPKDLSDPFRSIGDGNVETLGTHEHVWGRIQELIGPTKWSRVIGTPVPASTSSEFQSSDGWYGISLLYDPVQVVSVRTSHSASTRNLIKELCVLLGVYAYDPQRSAIVEKP